MALALLANTAPRINAILGANPGVWSASVSGTVGAFPDISEITAASLEADGELITRGYFNSVNAALAQPFMAACSPLLNGGQIPFHYGNYGMVEVAHTVKTFTTGSVNTTTDEITASSNGFQTGDPISFFGPSGVPSPLVADQTYYAIAGSSQNTFQVAATPADAANGTAVNLTSQGSGTMTVVKWQGGQEAESIDDIKNALAVGNSYVESGAFNYLWKVDSGNLYHAAAWGRVEIPTYNRTTALQANKTDEPIIIALAVKLLTKNASPAMFQEWGAIAEAGIQSIIRDGMYQAGVPQQ